MGYARFPGEDFFLALLSSRKSRRNGDPTIQPAEGMNCSSGKLNAVSDFLQEIAGATSAAMTLN
jgi:hypothetical protein